MTWTALQFFDTGKIILTVPYHGTKSEFCVFRPSGIGWVGLLEPDDKGLLEFYSNDKEEYHDFDIIGHILIAEKPILSYVGVSRKYNTPYSFNEIRPIVEDYILLKPVWGNVTR